jgi:hypothetical protein
MGLQLGLDPRKVKARYMNCLDPTVLRTDFTEEVHYC